MTISKTLATINSNSHPHNLRLLSQIPRLFSTTTTTIPTTTATSSAVSDSLHKASSSQPRNHHPGSKQRGIWAKMLLFVPGAISFGLGTWQIFRRQDKIEMLYYRMRRLEMEPVQLNTKSLSENLNALEFRKVMCKGTFDEKKSIFVGPRSRSISGVTENGYYLITPLLPLSGDSESVQSPVLVNRGWVPRSWRDKFLESAQDVEVPRDVTSSPILQDKNPSFWRFWAKNPPKDEEPAPVFGSVEVVGVVRGSERPSIFVPENDPGSAQWFFVDVPTIANVSRLPENTIYVEAINDNVSPRNPYPIPKDANSLIRSSVMPQDHLNYTITWYSLSAAVTFMAYKRLKPRRIRG